MSAVATLDDRAPCEWCGAPTARIGNDGAPRHGWCESPQTWIWRGVLRRPTSAPGAPVVGGEGGEHE